MGRLPEGFLIGATTAAHQVEGNNVHSDAWAQEQMKNSPNLEPSLDAVDHYHRYAEDIELLAQAGLNTYRFSIEWARIEPQEGVFNDAEVEHYRDMIRCCKANGILPVVCLHHFTSPKWLIPKGGWEAESTIDDFKRYCVYVIERLGNELEYVCTINEANMRLQFALVAAKYMKAAQNQQKASADAGGGLQVGVNLEAILARKKAADEETAEVFGLKDASDFHPFQSVCTSEGDLIVFRAHSAARDGIKALYPNLKVGITLSLHDLQAVEGGENAAAQRWADEFTHYLPYIQNDDFVGVQNYTRELMNADGPLSAPVGADLTDMGHEFYPEGLAHVIRKVAQDYKGDIIVTEHGVAAESDSLRVEFIRRAMQGIENCLAEGIPVKGYLHWSLMDNYEWAKAYSVKFGLIAVDRATQTRHPKPSLAFLGNYNIQ